MDSGQAKIYVDDLYDQVHRHWQKRIHNGEFMTRLRDGTLPLPCLRRFFKDWGLFSIEVVALNAVSYYVHLPFFVENFDLLAPLCDKVAEELISPKPPGHILILLETANALGLSKEELFEQPASAPGRAISDYCRRVFQDGSIIELWGAHVYEETLGHWSQQWSQALVGHYGMSKRQAIYFNAHAEADLVQHDDHMGHGPLNRMILQRILGAGQDRQKIRLRSQILRLHHGRSACADGTARLGQSLPGVSVNPWRSGNFALRLFVSAMIGPGALMRSRFFFSLCLLVTISIAANAPAQLPGKWTTRAPMPSARTEVAAVEISGKIYVIGGYDKGSHLVEEYDPATDSWRAPRLPAKAAASRRRGRAQRQDLCHRRLYFRRRPGGYRL